MFGYYPIGNTCGHLCQTLTQALRLQLTFQTGNQLLLSDHLPFRVLPFPASLLQRSLRLGESQACRLNLHVELPRRIQFRLQLLHLLTEHIQLRPLLVEPFLQSNQLPSLFTLFLLFLSQQSLLANKRLQRLQLLRKQSQLSHPLLPDNGEFLLLFHTRLPLFGLHQFNQPQRFLHPFVSLFLQLATLVNLSGNARINIRSRQLLEQFRLGRFLRLEKRGKVVLRQ